MEHNLGDSLNLENAMSNVSKHQIVSSKVPYEISKRLGSECIFHLRAFEIIIYEFRDSSQTFLTLVRKY